MKKIICMFFTFSLDPTDDKAGSDYVEMLKSAGLDKVKQIREEAAVIE